MRTEDQVPALKSGVNDENIILNALHRYLMHWKWFLLSVVLCLATAVLFLRYQTPQYEVRATILIKDDKKGGGLSELSAFEDLGLLKSAKNLDNEIEILKSRALMTVVAKELRLNVQYFVDEKPIAREQFESPPLYLVAKAGDAALYNAREVLVIVPRSNTDCDVTAMVSGVKCNCKFGEDITLPFGKVTLLATRDLQAMNLIGQDIKVVITPLESIVESYRSRIKIDPVNKTSNVISIVLRDAVREKAAAIIDNLIKQHNADAIADKNLVSKNTAEFINERIKYITEELADVEEEVENFKTTHKLVDVESEAKLFLETGSASESEIVEANTQKALTDYMLEYINQHVGAGDLIPSNLGLSDVSVAAVISEYNKLVLNRNRLLKSSSEKNPMVENLDTQLLDLRKSIKESLSNLKDGLEIKIAELSRQEKGINSKIATVPRYERQYRMIQRQQQIKETLYLYLLQKREETNIALAVTVANAKVIDKAYSTGEKVAPKSKFVVLLGLLTGLLIPIVFLYLSDLVDNKVHGKRDIDQIGVPFLGDIPTTDSKQKIVVTRGDSSSVSEAFRLLRTNVDFLLPTSQSLGKTVFLTSTLGKEGKSFAAINLAASIAISGKKVLLVGMDLRAPKILEYLQFENRAGITNYISSNDLKLEDVIMKDPCLQNFDVLPSGNIPPNPSELLLSDKVEHLFEQLRKQYDYIIVDTAPVGMVTDTLLLSKYADVFIYVVRAHYLDKRLLTVAADLYRERRLPNMAILLNGTDKSKGYGYGYGYGYGGYGYGQENKKSFIERVFKFKG